MNTRFPRRRKRNKEINKMSSAKERAQENGQKRNIVTNNWT